MNELLTRRCAMQGGVFTTADATECGCSAAALAALVRSEACVRLARGLYAVRSPDARPEERHRQLVTAMLLRWQGRAAASHHSALVLHDLPTFGADLRQAQLVGLRGTNTRRFDDVRVHLPVPGDALTSAGGWATVTPAVALAQHARLSGSIAGVVAADAALHRSLVTRPQLAAEVARIAGWTGSRRAATMLRFADGRSESVGESRLRLELVIQRIPVIPQFKVVEAGQVVARADFRVKGARVLVEFDGLVKYRGGDGPRAVVEEKRREDRLRRLGWLVERVVWAELAQPAWIAARVRMAVDADREMASRQR